MGLSPAKTDETIFAVGEALANAVEHGYQPNGEMTVRVAHLVDQGAVVVEVEDDGPGFDVARSGRYRSDATRGFGLTIMHEMADRVEFELGGRRVRIWKAFAPEKRSSAQRSGREGDRWNTRRGSRTPCG